MVITALGGLALYGLCRDLGVARARGALGVATFLFNPLVFVLAFTFMTDAHFMALLVIATWLYARAIAPDGIDGRLLVAGSGVAALAFLTRQQGALIVPAVVVFLLLSRRLRFDRASILVLAQLFALPLLAAGGYYLWLRYGNDVPQVQSAFFREILEEGWSGTWWLLRRLTVVELMYLGLFALPLMGAVLPAVRGIVRVDLSSWLDPVCGLASDPPRWRHCALGARRADALHRAVFRFRRARRARMSSARVRSCSVPRSARR